MKNIKLFVFTICAILLSIVSVNAQDVSNESDLSSCLLNSDSVCRLTAEITLSSSIDVTRNVTIDLNGQTITSSATYTISVQSNAELTIEGEGTITNSNKGVALFVKNGKGIINGGNFSNNDDSSTNFEDCFPIIQVGASSNKGELIVNSGSITGTAVAIKVAEGNSKVTINGGDVKSNYHVAILTGSNTSGATIELNGGTVSSESTESAAVQVGYIDNSSGVLIVNNGAKINGIVGGILVAGTNSTATINGGEITSTNGFAISGNGAETTNSTIEINGGNLTSENTAAIYHPQTGTLTINGGNITGVFGIVARQGNINITDGNITANGSQDVETSVGDATDGNGNLVQLPTGTAIIVDNSETAYEGTAKVTVTGDKAIIEGSTQSILSYNDDKTTDFDITGGTFLSNGIRDDVTTFLTNHSNYGQSQSGLVGIVHNITKDIDTDKGTIESYDNATKDEKVEFSVKTKSVDYAVDSISVKTNDNQTVEYSSDNGNYSFVMPDKDVTISVRFKVVYAYYGSLNDALKEASSIDTSKYTEDSVKKLEEAIENAKNVSKSLKASQQYSIDTLTTALKTAIANLVLVNPSSSEEKPEEPTPNTYDAGPTYVGLAIIALGTTLISIRKLRNN